MGMSAVIVNYRTAHLIEELVFPLLRDPSVQDIIVVDNSPDDGANLASLLSPPVRYVPLPKNVGFAVAVNTGVRHAEHRYVAVINPDVRPEPQCLRRLWETAHTLKASLVGPRFYWDSEKTFRLPPATGACLWWDLALHIARYSPLDAEILQQYWIMRHDRFWSHTAPFVEPFLSGALMVLDRRALARHDDTVLDERFFLYYEDSDLSLKALQTGRLPLCDPRAEAVHYWNQSPEPNTPKAALMADAHKAFYNKYYQADSPAEAVHASFEKIQNWKHFHEKVCPGHLGVEGFLNSFSSDTRPRFLRLEKTRTAPVFLWPKAKELSRPLYFEFALSPHFIPFAQADFTGESFLLPESIWLGLAPGTYYCRLRSPRGGPVVLWEWTKDSDL